MQKICLASLAGLIFVSVGRAGTFQIIGSGVNFQPYALSADGQTMVGAVYSSSLNNPLAAIWTPSGGLTYLPNPGSAVDNLATAISANGSVIVGFQEDASNVATAWRWTAGGGYQLITAPGFGNSDAQSVSADGKTIGIQGFDTNYTSAQTYLWNASTGLSALPGTPSAQTPLSVFLSPDAKTATGVTLQNSTGYVWTSSGGSQDIPTVAGTTSFNAPEAMTPDGSIIYGVVHQGGPLGPAIAIFQYTGGTTTSLGNPNPNPGSGDVIERSDVAGTSANGQILVGNEFVEFNAPPLTTGYYTWVWTPGNGFESLPQWLANNGVDTGGYAIQNISGISADGTIVFGYGSTSRPGAVPSAWIAYLPEPGGAIVLAILPGTLVRRRRVLR